ncbi:MAG: hypothetical protein ACLP7O_09545 [Terracidiphilus sp.]
MNGAWTGAFLTAFGAIVGSAIGAFVQYLVSRNQQKEQRRNAEIMRRNKLADELRERVLEVIGPATWFYLAKWKGTQRDIEENAYTIKLTDSIARVRLMLDAKVDTHAELMKALESVRSAAFTSDTKDVAQFENAIDSVQKIASTVISQASTQTTLGAPF